MKKQVNPKMLQKLLLLLVVFSLISAPSAFAAENSVNTKGKAKVIQKNENGNKIVEVDGENGPQYIIVSKPMLVNP